MKFYLPKGENGDISILNSSGNKVEVVFSGVFQKGENKFQWRAANLPDGIYFIHIKIGRKIISKRLVHVR